MQTGEQQQTGCPVGEQSCPRLDELSAARDEAAALSELVRIDPLTGLFNFRHFQQSLGQEMERTRRSGHPLSLVMVDLDHFKQVNDEWGHEVGNRVLRHLAALMQGLLRKIDIPCRYGGEEFALILPGTELPRAVGAAERLRRALQDQPLDIDGQPLRVTASMGVEVCMKGDGTDMEAFVARADGYLYQAKEAGRNRVCHRDFEQLRPKGQVSREEKADLFGPP